jgi:chromosome segregation ATPase
MTPKYLNTNPIAKMMSLETLRIFENESVDELMQKMSTSLFDIFKKIIVDFSTPKQRKISTVKEKLKDVANVSSLKSMIAKMKDRAEESELEHSSFADVKSLYIEGMEKLADSLKRAVEVDPKLEDKIIKYFQSRTTKYINALEQAYKHEKEALNESELEKQKALNEAEIEKQKALNEVEAEKQKALNEAEAEKARLAAAHQQTQSTLEETKNDLMETKISEATLTAQHNAAKEAAEKAEKDAAAVKKQLEDAHGALLDVATSTSNSTENVTAEQVAQNLDDANKHAPITQEEQVTAAALTASAPLPLSNSMVISDKKTASIIPDINNIAPGTVSTVTPAK